MPTFNYIARDQRGLVQVGHLEALDEDEVVAMLQHRGLLVTSIARKDLVRDAAAVQARRARRVHARVTLDDHVLFCQQLATMVEAGVPLLRGLEVVCAQMESRMLLLAVEEIRRDVEAGSTLRDAMGKYPMIFSKLWLNLVETGEASGHLAQSLNQLAQHLESARRLQTAAKTALTYPAVLLIAAVSVIVGFVYWLIPKFTPYFTAMQVELPPITKMALALSDIARRYVVIVVALVIAVGYAIRRYLRTEGGQWLRDRIVLRLPMLQNLFAYVQLAEFSRGLTTLLESGVPLLSSLELLENSATNKVYGQAIGNLRQSVEEGKSMAEPMAQEVVFPPMVVQMVQVGEEVGELAKMSGKIAQYYEDKVATFIARMTQLFEPVAIIIMAFLVFFVVLSIFMPIFKMAGSAGIGS